MTAVYSREIDGRVLTLAPSGWTYKRTFVLYDKETGSLWYPGKKGLMGIQGVYFSSIFKWYGEDFVAKYSPTSGFTGLDKTERAVANFCSGYLISADRDFLSTGGYSVKYLDYDWSLNEK